MACPLESHNSELLVAYAAGELEMEAAHALERHLEECPACSALAAGQAAVWKALDAWQAPAISPDFDARLYRRVRTEAPATWWRRLWRPLRPMPLFKVLPLAAAACMLLIVSVLLERPANIEPVAPRAETVRVDQVERTLDDLELLNQFDVASHTDSAHPNTM